LPSLTSVVVNFHSERWLPRCIETLYAGGSDAIVVVDNDRLDPVVLDGLRQICPILEYIQSRTNVGFGQANNIGIECALANGADYIGIINPDVWFEPGWLGPILSGFLSHSEYGMLAPLQLEYQGSELSDWARKIVGLAKVREWRPGGRPVDVSWIEGSAMIVRREVFEKVGAFDEIFEMYFEDNDLCRRALLAGYKIGVVPESKYHHYGSGSFAGNHTLERNIRIDLSQLIYSTTDPRKTIPGNLYSLTYACGQMGWSWFAGRRATFPYVIWRLIPSLWRKRAAIRRKWKSERSLGRSTAETQGKQRQTDV